MAELLNNITDAELEEMMDARLRDRLYNCTIVSDSSGDNDDEVV